MSKYSYARLERDVGNLVQRMQLDKAVEKCEHFLASLKPTEYHSVLKRDWQAQTSEAAAWLFDFYRSALADIDVQALYCEMNRFEINTDQWYLDAFAYDFVGEADDLGWLVGWKTSTSEENRFVLKGMEDLQALFERDYAGEPPTETIDASSSAILLLTLRMQQLVGAAALEARRLGVPQATPVLATAHDSEFVAISHGSIKPKVTKPAPAKPIPPVVKPGDHPSIYTMDGGYDEYYNSLPWDVLDYVRERDNETTRHQLDRDQPLTDGWIPLPVKIRKRKWRCDLIQLYPHWVMNEKAYVTLEPLLRGSVEFLPLAPTDGKPLWIVHALRHVELGSKAIHNASIGSNMTVIEKYDFEVSELKGKHLFRVKQAPGSPARKVGFCFGFSYYVSDDFCKAFADSDLQGVKFQRVFQAPEGCFV